MAGRKRIRPWRPVLVQLDQGECNGNCEEVRCEEVAGEKVGSEEVAGQEVGREEVAGEEGRREASGCEEERGEEGAGEEGCEEVAGQEGREEGSEEARGQEVGREKGAGEKGREEVRCEEAGCEEKGCCEEGPGRSRGPCPCETGSVTATRGQDGVEPTGRVALPDGQQALTRKRIRIQPGFGRVFYSSRLSGAWPCVRRAREARLHRKRVGEAVARTGLDGGAF